MPDQGQIRTRDDNVIILTGPGGTFVFLKNIIQGYRLRYGKDSAKDELRVAFGIGALDIDIKHLPEIEALFGIYYESEQHDCTTETQPYGIRPS